MTAPAPTHRHPGTRALHDQAQALCAELAALPFPERLSALADLDRALESVTGTAIQSAAADARTHGWPLRRIASLLNLSHEQIRILTAAPARPAADGDNSSATRRTKTAETPPEAALPSPGVR